MKKNIIRVVSLVLAILMLSGIVLGAVLNAQEWTEDIYAYGAGLSESQINSTAGFLEVPGEDTPKMVIRGEDAVKYIDEDASDAAMISSVYIKKNNTNDVNVEVVTPLTIQSVTSLQYANAAITAGVTGIDIKVAAVVPVSGTSALTGVYKALEKMGVEVDSKKTEKANEEIERINEISENHKDNPDFSKDKLNKAVIDGKQQIIDIEKNEGNITANQIDQITQNVIKDNQLTNIVNNIDIENLNIIFNNFAEITKSEGFDFDKVQSQLKNLADNINNIAKKELNRAQAFLKTDEGNAFLESIKDKLNADELNALLEKGKASLDSGEIEKALNSVKENISTEKLNELVDSAREKFGISQETIDNVSNSAKGFFSKIIEAISEFFRKLFSN